MKPIMGAVFGILCYAIGIGLIIFTYELGVRYLSSPHSEVLKMEMHEIDGGTGMKGV
jgi:hypothetical protein